jgi:DNA (cytosine-5)-methyltransferase 1
MDQYRAGANCITTFQLGDGVQNQPQSLEQLDNVGVNGVVRAIDLFAGAGGLTLGFRRAGITTIAAVEIDPYAVQTFRSHTPDSDLFEADIQQVNLRVYAGKVDLLYGGPPCQPFSSGGLRQSAKDERDMVPWFIRAVRELHPQAFFMENVPGLAVGSRGTYLSSVIREFRSLDYTITWQVVNAASYGVPQKRCRLFVVGMQRKGYLFPKATHGPGTHHPYVVAGHVLKQPVGEPPASRVVYAKTPDLRPNPYDGHLFNGGGRAIDLSQPSHTILASAGGNKTHFLDEQGLVPEYHQHLRNGGQPRTGYLPGGRRLSVEESAMLQTFPPDFVFAGPRSAQYEQIGNAVPPDLAYVLGKALVEQMTTQDRDYATLYGYGPRQLTLL